MRLLYRSQLCAQVEVQADIYLNVLPNFRHPDCFTAIIPGSSSYVLRKVGIQSPDDLTGRRIRVRGRIDRIGEALRLIVPQIDSGFELFTDTGELLIPVRDRRLLGRTFPKSRMPLMKFARWFFLLEASAGRPLGSRSLSTRRRPSQGGESCRCHSVHALVELEKLGIEIPDEEIVDQIIKIKGEVNYVRGELQIRADDPVDQIMFQTD